MDEILKKKEMLRNQMISRYGMYGDSGSYPWLHSRISLEALKKTHFPGHVLDSYIRIWV